MIYFYSFGVLAFEDLQDGQKNLEELLLNFRLISKFLVSSTNKINQAEFQFYFALNIIFQYFADI